MKKKLWILSFIMAIMFMMAGANLASASTVTLTSNLLPNASSVDITSGKDGGTPGMSNWQIGGTSSSQLKLQWFWFKIGGTTTRLGEDYGIIEPIIVEDTTSKEIPGSNQDKITITYTYVLPGGNLDILTTYSILGGYVPPSGHIDETITFLNYDQENSVSLRLYEYNDFDVAGTTYGDTGYALSSTQINQIDGGGNISEVSALSPDSYEIGLQADIYNAVITGANLSPNGVGNEFVGADNLGQDGVDDVAWAFSWELNIPKATSFPGILSISKDKNIVTPVPTTLLLFGSGLFSLIGVGIRRRKS